MTPVLTDDVEREVARLVKAGEHAAAAAALRHHQQFTRAAALYESIFERAQALACFEAAGDVVGAVRVAIALQDTDALERLVGDAIARGLGDTLLTSLVKANRHAEVGRVYVARGELLLAARAYEAGGLFADAARCHEELGASREAGVLLERWLEQHPHDDVAALRLGRILARFGRHDDAVTLLQRAMRDSADADLVTCRAAPTLGLAFVALGYDDAARHTISRWRAAYDRVVRRAAPVVVEAPPADLDELLHSARAAAFAAVQETSSTSTQPPTDASGDDLFDALSPASSSSSSLSPSLSSSPSIAVPDGPEVVVAEQRLLLNGRYLLGEPLGGGGVGQVFRAYDAFADRAVAVKILAEQVLTSDAVGAWARDVRAAAGLAHPAIVRLVELNMAQGFLVTELHGEGDGAVLLEDKLQQGSTDAGWLLPALVAILDALAACHRTGLVHGGLKPRNAFVVQGGVKLLDTGAHRLLALRATETGGLASVWPYLSPELLFGAPADVDGDLYAVAAIAYRAVCGRPPFSQAQSDRRQPPVRADVVNPQVPAAWADFFAHALSPTRAERFADADDMRRALPLQAPPQLPAAVSVEQASLTSSTSPLSSSTSVTSAAANDRYRKGALRLRSSGVRVWEGIDALVARPVWLVERDGDDDGGLARFVPVARQWRGVQPVYDVIVDEQQAVLQVVLARDAHNGSADLAALRAVPQGLARDLVAVAEALTALHVDGVALGGFDLERASGPVGPRLRFAPAPLPVAASAEAMAADWASFEAVVDAAFDTIADDTLDARGRVLAALHNGRFLERHDLEALARERDATWPRFLLAVVEVLSRGAQGRTVARLVAAVVRG
jgi:tetratricopeptide (TPR) repeat protein